MELCCCNGEPIQLDASEASPSFDALSNAVYNHHKYGGAVPIKLRIGADVLVEVDSACEEFACKVVAAYSTIFPEERVHMQRTASPVHGPTSNAATAPPTPGRAGASHARHRGAEGPLDS